VVLRVKRSSPANSSLDISFLVGDPGTIQAGRAIFVDCDTDVNPPC
jgi:hypothetical protein